MSRRQSRTSARASRPSGSPNASAASGTDAIDAGELHRLAVERRESRMGGGRRPADRDVPRGIVTDAGAITLTVPIKGMTCRACEVRISRTVGRLPGVERATASAVHGLVVVESSVPVSSAAIEKAINKAGYEIGRTPWLVSDPMVWATAGAGVLIVAVAAVLAQVTGVADLASGAGDISNGGLVVALLLGLAAACPPAWRSSAGSSWPSPPGSRPGWRRPAAQPEAWAPRCVRHWSSSEVASPATRSLAQPSVPSAPA